MLPTMTATSPGSAALAVDAREVGCTFATGTEALAKLHLNVEAGTFVSIVGPSGCGKSTFLRLAAGLLEPTQGRITVGEAGQSPREARRVHRTGFVFQFPTLLPWRTVEDNVRLPLELGPPRATSEDREALAEVEGMLERVRLHGFARAYPRELSGGMQMRVSLARALILRPRLLLLDEPFGALDEITRQLLNEELVSFWERDHWTAVFVTHNVAEAVFLSDRVFVLSARPGRVITDIEVPLPHPRRPEMRGDPQFGRLVGEIGASLRGALAGIGSS